MYYLFVIYVYNILSIIIIIDYIRLKANRERSVKVKEFIDNIPISVVGQFRKKLLDYIRERKFRSKLKRRTPYGLKVDPDATIRTTSEEFKAVTEVEDDPEDEVEPEGEDDDGEVVINENATVEPEEVKDPLEEYYNNIHFKEAALLIQRVLSRGRSARIAAAKKRDAIRQQRTQLALSQEGFLEIAADILTNTMFNLVQEASFGEFNMMSEPLKFMIRK